MIHKLFDTIPDHSNAMNVILTSRILIAWMVVLTFILFFNFPKENRDGGFFAIGPNDNFVFMEIKINTLSKYFLLVLSMCLNTCIRNLNQDILNPWLIQNVQNENKLTYSNATAYEITIVNGMFTWFDYIFCLNLVIIQIDMILIQIFVDTIANAVITKIYIKSKDNYRKITIPKNYDSFNIIS